MRGAAVLRPEPGNSATVARLKARGIDTLALPLFRVVPISWELPSPDEYDALLLTSANAVRHGGAGLAKLTHLPVIAVGEATAAAARAAGFAVRVTGASDAAAALAAGKAAGACRPLHLGGRERRGVGVDAVAVYASELVLPAPREGSVLHDRIALVHSARAGEALAMLAGRDGLDRSRIAVAGLSPEALAAAGSGWAWGVAAKVPSDPALVALVAERLTTPPGQRISGA